MQAVQVGMHMGVDQTGHQGCAVGIDDSCPGWYLAADSIDVCPVNHDGLILDDTLPVEHARVSDSTDYICLTNLFHIFYSFATHNQRRVRPLYSFHCAPNVDANFCSSIRMNIRSIKNAKAKTITKGVSDPARIDIPNKTNVKPRYIGFRVKRYGPYVTNADD